MREVVTMWRDTRMILLTAVVAAVFAAILIPFKAIQILPGFASVRPAESLPVAFGLMFGPAGAWGIAIGNLIGDVFGGTLNPGSLFGFVANFFHAFVAYKLWGNLGRLSSGEEPAMRTRRQIVEYVVIAIVASATTAAILGWGLDLLGLFPFSVFASVVLVVGIPPNVVIGPILLYLLYPRLKEMGLLYPDAMNPQDLRAVAPSRRRLAAFVIAGVSIVWVIVGMAVSVGLESAPFVAQLGAVAGQGGSTAQAVIGLIAFVILLGASLISAGGLPEQLGRIPAAPEEAG